jgi:MOSC domain-containing protein YiiM
MAAGSVAAQVLVSAAGMARVQSVQVGKAAPLGPQGVPSGFIKRPVEHRLSVRDLGLDGDEQADLRVHGGPEKAVYAYALAHYESWKADFPEHSSALVAGGFGENLTIEQMAEADICVGDVHKVGSAILQVCQPRQPCFKLVLRFNDNRLPSAMVKSGRSGWYYRVLGCGDLGEGDEIALIDRPHPDFPFEKLVEFVNFGTGSDAELTALGGMEGAASWIRRRALERLAARRGV